MKFLIPRTRSTIDSETVEFFPHAISFTDIALTNFLKQVAINIESIIQNLPLTTSPVLQVVDEENNSLLEV